MNCSLIITTYNWPEALNLVLLTAVNQSVQPNEIIIADDGSTEDTEFLINKFSNGSCAGNTLFLRSLTCMP